MAQPPEWAGTIKAMGTAPSFRLRWLAWGCLGLVLAYALLLAWYFPWRRHVDALEIVFKYQDPSVEGASMVFTAPSGWIFLNCHNRVGCYRPPIEDHAPSGWDTVSAQDSISCMTLAGDSLYYCTISTGPQRTTEFKLARLDKPPEPVWDIRMEDQTAQVLDVAACSDHVCVLDQLGALAGYHTANGRPLWRTELLPQPDQASSGATHQNQYQYQYQYGNYGGTTTKLAVDEAGTAYALLNGDTVHAVDAEGEKLWEAKLPYQSAVTLELASRLGLVYVLDDTGAVSVLDCASGSVAWQAAGQGHAGGMGIEGLPCVGGDGSVIMIDANYAFVVVEPGGQNQRQLTQNFEYGSHLKRLADGGVLVLGDNQLKALSAQGNTVWLHGAGSSLFGNGFSFVDSKLGLTQDGTAIWCRGDVLYGLRPRKLSLAPAKP